MSSEQIRVYPINRDYSGPSERVRLVTCRLTCDYPTKEFHHYWLCKQRHLVSKIRTNANCIAYWSNLEPMLVAPPVGQILNSYKWNHIQLAKFGTNASGILFSWREIGSQYPGSVVPLAMFFLRWDFLFSYSNNGPVEGANNMTACN